MALMGEETGGEHRGIAFEQGSGDDEEVAELKQLLFDQNRPRSSGAKQQPLSPRYTTARGPKPLAESRDIVWLQGPVRVAIYVGQTISPRDSHRSPCERGGSKAQSRHLRGRRGDLGRFGGD